MKQEEKFETSQSSLEMFDRDADYTRCSRTINLN